MLHQRQAGLVGPVDVVEEQHHRPLARRHHRDEALHRRVQAAARLGRRQLGHGRRLADDEREIGASSQTTRVRSERVAERVPQRGDAALAAGEQRLHQVAQQLAHGAVGLVLAQRVVLAGGPPRARRRQRLRQLAGQRRLADAGRPGQQHHLARPGLAHALERAQHLALLALALVEPRGAARAARQVALPQREDSCRAGPVAAREAALEVVEDAVGALVALLPRLGEELHGDARDHRRQLAAELGRRHRLERRMHVHPGQRVRGAQRQAPGEELVERDAEGVEVRALVGGVRRPVEALGREVGGGRRRRPALGVA
ncbi:MAG: hypothetical protein U1F43_37975 [Myxococcota bacterium]